MEINVDFTEADSPSAKQIDFAQEISRKLDVPLPKDYTRSAYSDFISEYVDEYRDTVWEE